MQQSLQNRFEKETEQLLLKVFWKHRGRLFALNRFRFWKIWVFSFSFE
jgi:hypothetical protein